MHLPMPVYSLGLIMALVATVFPALMLNVGIHRIGSNRASLVSSIGPVSTILLAWAFLGEQVTPMQLLGTALVLLGVLLITMKPLRRRVAT